MQLDKEVSGVSWPATPKSQRGHQVQLNHDVETEEKELKCWSLRGSAWCPQQRKVAVTMVRNSALDASGSLTLITLARLWGGYLVSKEADDLHLAMGQAGISKTIRRFSFRLSEAG